MAVKQVSVDLVIDGPRSEVSAAQVDRCCPIPLRPHRALVQAPFFENEFDQAGVRAAFGLGANDTDSGAGKSATNIPKPRLDSGVHGIRQNIQGWRRFCRASAVRVTGEKREPEPNGHQLRTGWVSSGVTPGQNGMGIGRDGVSPYNRDERMFAR